MMMKVMPRFCQTVVTDTAASAVSLSCSQRTGSRPSSCSSWFTTPIDGLNSVSHMSEATATDVATVDEKIVRKIVIPRSRSEEHTSELQSLMRNSYAVFCLKKKPKEQNTRTHTN